MVNLMEIDPLFLNSELLHLLMFTPQNLAVKNYCDIKKLKPLLEIIPYNAQIIDINELTSNEVFDLYISQMEIDRGNGFDEPQTLLVVQNPTLDSLQKLLNADWLKWMTVLNGDPDLIKMIEKDESEKVTMYNSKLGHFSKSFVDKTMLQWEDGIMSFLADYDDIDVAIQQTKGLTEDFYRLTKQIYTHVVNDERKKLKGFIRKIMKSDPDITAEMLHNFLTHYFKINVNEYIEVTIKEKKPKPHIRPNKDRRVIDYHEPEVPKDESLSPILDEQIDDLNAASIELEYILNSAKAEYLCVKNSSRQLFKSFVGLLFDNRDLIDNPYIHENQISPQDLYLELRLGPWNENVPSGFLVNWLVIHLKRISKSRKSPLSRELLQKEIADFNKLISNFPGTSKITVADIKNAMCIDESRTEPSNGSSGDETSQMTPKSLTTSCSRKSSGKNPFKHINIDHKSHSAQMENNADADLDNAREFLKICIDKEDVSDIGKFTESLLSIIRSR